MLTFKNFLKSSPFIRLLHVFFIILIFISNNVSLLESEFDIIAKIDKLCYIILKEVKDMRPLKVKAIVVEEFNDSKNNGELQELDKILELDYGRFEQLRSLGKVEEYKELSKPMKKEEKNENSDTIEVK